MLHSPYQIALTVSLFLFRYSALPNILFYLCRIFSFGSPPNKEYALSGMFSLLNISSKSFLFIYCPTFFNTPCSSNSDIGILNLYWIPHLLHQTKELSYRSKSLPCSNVHILYPLGCVIKKGLKEYTRWGTESKTQYCQQCRLWLYRRHFLYTSQYPNTATERRWCIYSFPTGSTGPLSGWCRRSRGMTTMTAAWTRNTRSAAAACTISPTAETASAATPSAPLPRSAAQSEQRRWGR